MSANFFEQVYQVIQYIPVGKVTSYGRIARMLGRPGAARAVGYALNALRHHDIENPFTSDTVPWHRVINSQGKISRRHHGSAAEEQGAKLRAEGVAVSDDMCIDMDIYLWEPAGEEISMTLDETLSDIAAVIES